MEPTKVIRYIECHWKTKRGGRDLGEETTGCTDLEIRLGVENYLVVGRTDADSTLTVLTHAQFEKVTLALETDEVHPQERVPGIVDLGLV